MAIVYNVGVINIAIDKLPTEIADRITASGTEYWTSSQYSVENAPKSQVMTVNPYSRGFGSQNKDASLLVRAISKIN